MDPVPPPRNGIDLRDFFEAILKEQARAVSSAEREREKAAQALRIELERARTEGDDRLRDHITNQIAQIRGDLLSADKLESERVNKAMSALESLRKETLLTAESDRRAVHKTEESAKEALAAARRESEQRSVESKERAKEHNGLLEKMGAQAQRSEQVLALAQEKFASRDDLTSVKELLSTRIDEVGHRIDDALAQAKGSSTQTAKVYAALAATGTAIAIVVVLSNVLSGG